MRVFKQNAPGLAALLLAATLVTSSNAQQAPARFQIQGTLRDMPLMPKRLYLVYDSLDAYPSDSANVVNGRYVFKGNTDHPVLAYITPVLYNAYRQSDAQDMIHSEYVAPVFIEKGQLSVASTKSIREAMVLGSTSYIDYKTANRQAALCWDSVMNVAETYKETQESRFMDVLFFHAKDDSRSILHAYLDFMRKHPGAAVNPYLIPRSLPPAQGRSAGQVDSLLAAYNRFPASLKAGVAGSKAGTLLEKEMKAAIGHPAPSFTQADHLGKTVSLSSLKGNYVLIYCWKANDPEAEPNFVPGLLKAYQTYSSKGLSVISVSLETDESTFQASAGKNALPWPQLWGGGGTAGSIGTLYGIDRSRENLLLDPNGRIIAKNLNINELPEVLVALFD